jgi:hypothetical protein
MRGEDHEISTSTVLPPCLNFFFICTRRISLPETPQVTIASLNNASTGKNNTNSDNDVVQT